MIWRGGRLRSSKPSGSTLLTMLPASERVRRDHDELAARLGGVELCHLLVPARYTHAHNGVISRRDFDQTVDLVVSMLKTLDAKTVAAIRDFTP